MVSNWFGFFAFFIVYKIRFSYRFVKSKHFTYHTEDCKVHSVDSFGFCMQFQYCCLPFFLISLWCLLTIRTITKRSFNMSTYNIELRMRNAYRSQNSYKNQVLWYRLEDWKVMLHFDLFMKHINYFL